MTETCPCCGSEPGDVSHSLAPNQEACTTEGCPVKTWDSSADSTPKDDPESHSVGTDMAQIRNSDHEIVAEIGISAGELVVYLFDGDYDVLPGWPGT